jgi:hypothetical protein
MHDPSPGHKYKITAYKKVTEGTNCGRTEWNGKHSTRRNFGLGINEERDNYKCRLGGLPTTQAEGRHRKRRKVKRELSEQCCNVTNPNSFIVH